MIDLIILSDLDSDTNNLQAAYFDSLEKDLMIVSNSTRKLLFSASFFLQLSWSLVKAASVLKMIDFCLIDGSS